ncbi:hypothetical protein ACQKJG_18935 [Priestia megaterium]|uniref:hypothetical protein n=1 Tax=Priestia megaterium TaxID=1404 RepID=UPI003D086977
MAQNLPELAVDDDFNSEALEPDEEGIYTVVEYYRKDRTLYMRSQLLNKIGKGLYAYVLLSYFDETGKVLLHTRTWQLGYDVNMKIVSKRID